MSAPPAETRDARQGADAWRGLRPLAAPLLLLCAVAALAGALAALPDPGETLPVDRELSTLDLRPWRDELVYGRVADGLPPYRTSWDGRPPRARVVAPESGRVVAPSVLRRETLEGNRAAVLWSRADGYRLTPEACELVVPAAAVVPGLVLRFEVPPPHATSARLAALGVALLLLAGVVWAGLRLARTPPERRLATLGRLALGGLGLALAGLAFVLHFPGPPWSEAETDTASISSFAAVADDPGAFGRDALLAEPANVDWYTPLHVVAARATRALGLGYGASFALFALAATLAGFVGFALLLRRVSGSALFGVAGALAITFLSAGYPPNERWVFGGGLPRDLFAGLLPWVLLLALRERDRPGRWYLPAAAGALLFYVHPVSSPALSGALLLALAAGGSAPWRRRVGGLAGATAATLAVMLPYTLLYASAYGRSTAGEAPSLSLLREVFAPLVPATFASDALAAALHGPRFWVLAVALALLARTALGRDPEAPSARMLWGGFAGLMIVTFAIPTIDWALAERLGRLPFQIDLPRNLRYLDVVLLLALALVVRRAGRRSGAPVTLEIGAGRRHAWLAGRLAIPVPALAGAALVLVLYGPSTARASVAAAARAESSVDLLQGRLDAVPAARLELVEAVEAFRRPGQRVLAPFDLDFLRQLSIPLAPTWKDPGTLSYSNPTAMRRDLEVRHRVEELTLPPVDRADARELSAVTDSELVVVERWRATPELWRACEAVFVNDRYLLWHREGCTILPPPEGRPLR